MELKKLILVHGMDTMTMSRFTNAGHVVVPVYNENGGSLLKDLILGNKENLKPSLEELPKEKVMILSDYSDAELRDFVAALRQIPSNSRPMLAVVTENSYNWTFEFLLKEHLIKDRDAIREMEKQKNK